MSAPLRVSIVLLSIALVAAGCEHPVPWVPQEIRPNPILDGPPRRLTFSGEGDWFPAWLPDGSGIGYSYHPLERSDRDRCLAFLPPEGGRVFGRLCRHGLRDEDSLNVISTHGVSAGGRVAVVYESGNPRRLAPAYRSLYLGRLGSDSLRPIVRFAFISPTGHEHLSAVNLIWPNESTLVYLATSINYLAPDKIFPPDTVQTGVEIVRLDLRGDAVAALTVVPGTLAASSVSRGPGDTVYYTLGGDSRVYALDVPTLQSRVFYDFGSLGVVRDVQVQNGRMVAIVGGLVNYVPFNPIFGLPQQADSGGPIVAVTLPSGAPQVIATAPVLNLPGQVRYGHLALSRSGRRVVAEMYRLYVRVLLFRTDTVISKQTDLWMFDVP